MTDKLKNDLLKSNIQCINECDGKFVFLRTVTTDITSSHLLDIPVLFSREIPVGSFLIARVSENNELKTLVFVCCNASQSYGINKKDIKNNLFWYEITDNGYRILPV